MITKAEGTIKEEDVVDTAATKTITRTATKLDMEITTQPTLTWEGMAQAPITWAMVDMETPEPPRVWIIMACNSINREEEDMVDSPIRTMITKSPWVPMVATSRLEDSSSSPTKWVCRALPPRLEEGEQPRADGLDPGSRIGVGTGSRRVNRLLLLLSPLYET
jgi:hypothetical protein